MTPGEHRKTLEPRGSRTDGGSRESDIEQRGDAETGLATRVRNDAAMGHLASGQLPYDGEPARWPMIRRTRTDPWPDDGPDGCATAADQ